LFSRSNYYHDINLVSRLLFLLARRGSSYISSCPNGTLEYHGQPTKIIYLHRLWPFTERATIGRPLLSVFPAERTRLVVRYVPFLLCNPGMSLSGYSGGCIPSLLPSRRLHGLQRRTANFSNCTLYTTQSGHKLHVKYQVRPRAATHCRQAFNQPYDA
jgi:hypothetical protein